MHPFVTQIEFHYRKARQKAGVSLESGLLIDYLFVVGLNQYFRRSLCPEECLPQKSFANGRVPYCK